MNPRADELVVRFNRFLARNNRTGRTNLELESLTRSFAQLNGLDADDLFELRQRVYN